MTLSGEELRALLIRLDGRGYKAYQEIKGRYELGWFTLLVDRVQPDPYAPPSRLRVRLPMARAGLPPDLYANRIRRLALEDFLLRSFYSALDRSSRGGPGEGYLRVERPSQAVLERTAVLVGPEVIEIRLWAGLPARGRTILGRAAARLLLEELPRAVEEGLLYANLNTRALIRQVDLVEDVEAIRAALPDRGLVAFVGDGSILPRRSGVDDRPLPAEEAVPFEAPPSLRVSFSVPHGGQVTGLGIPRGITLVVGGGYHGKSTLLRALEVGVYPHLPGDGREYVVTHPSAVKIRAEDGRYISAVDISNFMADLPSGDDTREFSTLNASGSTSQAANIVEALEAGAELLLVDEDTSATNFMIRDARMQRLVSREREPITPFLDRVQDLKRAGVSSILVLGGSGDYFDVADCVILMESYRPQEVTAQAREVAQTLPTGRRSEERHPYTQPRLRAPLPWPGSGREGGEERIKVYASGRLQIGRAESDLSAVAQLVEEGQLRAVGEAVGILLSWVDGRRTVGELLTELEAKLEEEGLDYLSPYPRGDLARPRRFEVAAALNRLRGLRFRPVR